MRIYNIRFIFIALLALITASYGAKNAEKDLLSSPTLITQGQNKNLKLSPERTKFVDQIGNNLLYRGSLPIENKQFILQKTLDSMVLESSRKTPVNKALVAPKTLPKLNNFIDFNLLTALKSSEKADFNIENDFFSKNPKLGKLIHYDVNVLFIKGITTGKVGELIDPVITDLRAQLSKVEDTPRIIYVHCEAGLDRTGATIAGYAMRYLKYSYIDALALNVTLGLREPQSYARLAIKLYAIYLRDVIGIKTIGKI
ncbi:hypothetical protein BHECKSOX2_1580 [Bathymodiolus heckerae thiotrophic gill symbiont]|uniref:dual specificity protein phosphatase family protein n=1 Tax=Bathymodiolus heckerae thiotrophic gill symbiont TaxID=1052212 RepID=UPI0010B4B418|nr:dual specificity protein phosphatase family protein [Bathymodiolus heckerae thiotrophic gill symbiont]SMN13009.1 hypothetical protein BHECKSOX2_1580 [Bathymodiolus heckerae thiotrophic gill symbiont]